MGGEGGDTFKVMDNPLGWLFTGNGVNTPANCHLFHPFMGGCKLTAN